eukprot:7681092-Alexandrium_andersonii.AAC.1
MRTPSWCGDCHRNRGFADHRRRAPCQPTGRQGEARAKSREAAARKQLSNGECDRMVPRSQ